MKNKKRNGNQEKNEKGRNQHTTYKKYETLLKTFIFYRNFKRYY